MQFQPGQSYPGFPGQQPPFNPQQTPQSSGPPGMMMPPDLAAMAQQGYAAQQAQLAAIQQRQQQQQQQIQQQSQQQQQQQPSFTPPGMTPQMQMQLQLQGMGMQIPPGMGNQHQQHQHQAQLQQIQHIQQQQQAQQLQQQQQHQQQQQQAQQQQQLQSQQQQQQQLQSQLQSQQIQQPNIHGGQQQPRADMGILERMQMQAMTMMPPKEYKPKRGKTQKIDRSAANQVLGRHTNHLGPPPYSENYRQSAMEPPSEHSSGQAGGAHETVEPWADGLDEIDYRELAMGRFRARQEVLGEVFGPEPIKDIPLGKGDAWEGLGLDGETLEAKVLALEKENEELERRIEGDSPLFSGRPSGLEGGEASAGIVA